MSNSTLGTYVNDNLAMVMSENELLGRCGEENAGSDGVLHSRESGDLRV